MKKKILVGSIIAVALLTLVSFTSVVGYSSVKSDIKTNSPLFSIRNKKGDVSSNYLGKGKVTNLLLPKRNDKVELIEKFANSIKMMDDKAFDRFVDFVIKQVYLGDDLQEYDKDEIVLLLHQLRDNPSEIKPYILQKKEVKLATEAGGTVCLPGCFTLKYGIETCLNLLLMIIIGLLSPFITIILFIYYLIGKLLTLDYCIL